MMLAFGVCFELPVLLTFLQLAGVVKNATLRQIPPALDPRYHHRGRSSNAEQRPDQLARADDSLVLFYEATVWIVGSSNADEPATRPSRRLHDNRGRMLRNKVGDYLRAR